MDGETARPGFNRRPPPSTLTGNATAPFADTPSARHLASGATAPVARLGTIQPQTLAVVRLSPLCDPSPLRVPLRDAEVRRVTRLPAAPPDASPLNLSRLLVFFRLLSVSAFQDFLPAPGSADRRLPRYASPGLLRPPFHPSLRRARRSVRLPTATDCSPRLQSNAPLAPSRGLRLRRLRLRPLLPALKVTRQRHAGKRPPPTHPPRPGDALPPMLNPQSPGRLTLAPARNFYQFVRKLTHTQPRKAPSAPPEQTPSQASRHRQAGVMLPASLQFVPKSGTAHEDHMPKILTCSLFLHQSRYSFFRRIFDI